MNMVLKVILVILALCLVSLGLQLIDSLKKYVDSRTMINDMNNWVQLQNLLSTAVELEVNQRLAKYKLSLEEYNTPRAYAEAKDAANSIFNGFTTEFKLHLFKIYPKEELMARLVDLCSIYLTNEIKKHNADVIENIQLG